MRVGENDPIWSLIPICMSYHLKKVTFKNFHANDSEICFLKCVLKYARVLEKMDIWWCKTQMQVLKKQRDVKKELEMIEASSTMCLVRFLWNIETMYVVAFRLLYIFSIFSVYHAVFHFLYCIFLASSQHFRQW